MNKDPLWRRASLPGVHKLACHEVREHKFQVRISKDDERVRARPLENELLPRLPESLFVGQNIFIRPEDYDGGYIGISQGFLDKCPASALVERDVVFKNRPIDAFGELQNVSPLGGELDVHPVSGQIDGGDGGTDPGADIVREHQGDPRARAAQGMPVAEHVFSLRQHLEIIYGEIHLIVTILDRKAQVLHCKIHHLLPVLPQGIRQPENLIQSFLKRHIPAPWEK